MKCPRCRMANRDGRRFCAKCGATLGVGCPECDFVNEPLEDFCGGCGRALTDNKDSFPNRLTAREAERRQLTVMFCDLVGSTALSHQLDPEDLREVIGRYQEWTRQVIARYEGFVARYMGDGMLVYFGYPRAHENDAARAIYTGLEIVETLERSSAAADSEHGVRLSVRIGIATGLVVVGDLIGEGTRQEAAVMGETPNVAARLQALAKPNSVVVAQATRDLAGGVFEYADQGLHKVKGLEPVRLWHVLRRSEAESRFDAAHGHRLTPFVGRDAEIECLLRCWQRARAGEGQVVLLSGEAGIGKSRIAESLGEHITDAPYVRLLYQCSPYHTNSALYPFKQQLERTATFARRDTARQKLDKLEALLAKSAVHDGDMVALLAALLSVPANGRYPPLHMTPEEQKEKTLLALLEHVLGLAAQSPVLILFEDLHWIDPTSMEFLDLLADRIRNIPALAIVTSRSTTDYSWVGLPHVRALRLERLDRTHSATMVRHLLARKRFPADIVEKIVARTDGVPLFIEELTRTLVTSHRPRHGAAATHGSWSEIPATLQDSLMARLDQLGSAREVAQIGAVIGREFSSDLLAAASMLNAHELHAALATLTSATIVFDRGESPWTTFVFKHALIQDAAYGSLLRSKRQELHERIAQALVASYPERARAEPEVVAHHYTQAGRSLPAATYWAEAARRSIDSSASLEALGHATKGLEVLTGVAPAPERDRLELALEVLRGAAYRAVKGFASSDAERSFLRAQELCVSLAEARSLIDVRRGLFSCYYARGALPLAQDQGQQVAEAGRKMNDPDSRMLGHWMLGCVTFWQGEFATARQELEKAYALYDPNEQRAKTLALQIDPGVNALCHLGWVLWILGFPDQARKANEKALATARELAQPFGVAMALFFACTTRASCGQHDAVRPLLDELMTVTTAHRLRYLGSCARLLEGQALIAHDHCTEGLEQIGRAFAEFAAQEAGVGLPWAMSIAVEAHTRLGLADEAMATLSRAFAAVGRNGEHHWEAELFRLKGEVLQSLTPADDTEAEACFRRSIDIARRQSAKSLELRATMSLGRLFDRQGKAELTHSLLHESRGWFTEGFDTADIRASAAMER
jgi:class 3 adenylate cyclase/tetratricopeptide (TPR) repeat protein